MKHILACTLTAVALITTGCSSDSDPDTTTDNSQTSAPTDSNQTSMPDGSTPTTPQTDNELDGTWTTGCVQDPDSEYYLVNLTVAGDSGTSNIFDYSDAACSNPTRTQEIMFSFAFPEGSVTTPLGPAKFIDVTIENNVVNGETLTNTGGVEFDIYLVSNDGNLYFGDLPAESANERPQNLESNFFIRL